MKRILLTMFLIVPICMFAQKGKFGWNKSIEGSFGYTHIYNAFGSDSYGTVMPTDLMSVDVYLYGIYFGAGMWEKDTGHSVYGYKEQVTTFDFRFGPSWRLKYEKTKLTFTPYFGWVSYTVDDTSNNAIGQRQDYGTRKSKFEGGMRFAFAYKYVEFGVNASNLECGASVGVTIDW